MRTKAIVAIGLVAAVIGLAWIGGEMHRRNCISEGNSACSVLPWDNGQSNETQLDRLVRKYNLSH